MLTTWLPERPQHRPGRRAARPGRLQALGAVVAAIVLPGLVLLSVRPFPSVVSLGPLPVSAALWATFAAGAWLILRTSTRHAIPLILLGGIAIQLAALSAPPRDSDDLYRYIWDGRIQAQGIDPYRYAPAAAQLAGLRDPFLWPGTGPHCVTPDQGSADGRALAPGCTRINLPAVHTIYPPVAEAYFAAVHEVSPSGSGSVPIQAGAALLAMATTGLLLAGLKSLGRDPRLAVLWAWCPVVGLEAGNNAHVDVLAALLTVAALLVLARPGSRRRTAAGGALLGLAVAAKLTPVLAVPAVLRRRPVVVTAAAVAATGTVYLPHILAVGSGVIGFLPGYLNAQGYSSGSRFQLLRLIAPGQWAAVAAVAVLALAGLAVLRTADPDRPWRGAVVMTGVALAVTTPWITWYSMLLVALVAMDGRAEWLALAAARYLTPLHPLPHLTIAEPSRVGYGCALAIVIAVSAVRQIRRDRGRLAVPGDGSPGASQFQLPAAVPRGWPGLFCRRLGGVVGEVRGDHRERGAGPLVLGLGGQDLADGGQDLAWGSEVGEEDPEQGPAFQCGGARRRGQLPGQLPGGPAVAQGQQTQDRVGGGRGPAGHSAW
jgi:hypothetical protein